MTELVAPSDRHLPHFAKTVARALEAGERVTLRYWSGQTELTFVCNIDTPGLSLDAHALRVVQDQEYRTVLWRDVYMVEDADSQYVDPRRLCALPWALAREVAAGLDADLALDREQWRMRDSFRRAFERRRQFAGGEYAPSFVAQLEGRLQPVIDPRDAEPHHYPPTGWQDRIARRDVDHPDYAATLEQLGMSKREDGRYTTTGPVDTSASAVYWRARLIELDCTPSNLNGVPVQRIPCAGYWFVVGSHEDFPEGLSQRLPLVDAINRVRSGHCPKVPQAPAPERLCGHCQKWKRDKWLGAFHWCSDCSAGWICLDCHNAHNEWHSAATDIPAKEVG